MKNFSRYNVPEDEAYEPDSNNLVLKNFLGIKSKEIMEELEEKELERTELELLKIYEPIQKIFSVILKQSVYLY